MFSFFFQAGVYYIILMDQSVFKLFFIIVIFYGFSLVIVYGKYTGLDNKNFSAYKCKYFLTHNF